MSTNVAEPQVNSEPSPTYMLTYKRPHYRDFRDELRKARLVAEFAVANKHVKRMLSTKEVKHIGLKSAIACQVLKKYHQPGIKKVTNVNLIIPSSNGNIQYDSQKGLVRIRPMNYTFRWDAGQPIVKICQIEMSETTIFINVQLPRPKMITPGEENVVGVDLNCGMGRHIAVMACLSECQAVKIGKQGPNIRKGYRTLRSRAQRENNKKMLREIGDREQRTMRDIDHKVSREIVEYAKAHSCRVVMEDLKGIRSGTKSRSSKGLRTVVNSWSFYRLQTFVEYKCQAAGVPFSKVKPHYTSQLCSYCQKIGTRDGPSFVCKSECCLAKGLKRDSDVNAAWNIAQRYVLTNGNLEC